MTAALIAIAVLGVLVGLYRLAHAALANSQGLHRAHAMQVAGILEGFDAERLRWEQERAVLLNRIADPSATAFSSTVAMLPPAGDMSMEVTR